MLEGLVDRLPPLPAVTAAAAAALPPPPATLPACIRLLSIPPAVLLCVDVKGPVKREILA
ncbi:hypothetical protein EJ08DRAFT_700306 [Tothia fuscella]|uniref:Uncharacterized protein n=1 Tax=Tothia fuscella TaxID=1048955 RepID=A0A9P4TV99_9PEZI|nr:hypothetical protein EJ08DRAFT_700306 [Tothia fuscella]